MKDKPKICFFIPRLGITDRGAEVVVYELAKRFINDFEVTVIVRKSKSKSRLLTNLKRSGVSVKKVRCIAAKSWFPRVLYGIRPLKKYLDKYHLNPDGIEMLTFSIAAFPRIILGRADLLFPANGVWGALVCRLIRLVKSTPFVYTAHGGIEPAIALQKPDIYFALNRNIERWYKEYFPKLKVVFLPNGVDLKRFKPKGNKAKVNLERPIYIDVAAFIPVKRLDLTIKAVAKLKKGSLIMLGDGPMKKDLLQLAEKELGSGRFLHKSVANYDMPAYYRSADIFTLAAKGEPSSLVCMEALASNLPVVVNDEELLRFLVGKAGILINVENLGKYSEALDKASRQNFGTHPLKQASKFSWENISKQYASKLLKIIHEKN